MPLQLRKGAWGSEIGVRTAMACTDWFECLLDTNCHLGAHKTHSNS